jgi:hypothetical protein
MNILNGASRENSSAAPSTGLDSSAFHGVAGSFSPWKSRPIALSSGNPRYPLYVASEQRLAQPFFAAATSSRRFVSFSISALPAKREPSSKMIAGV